MKRALVCSLVVAACLCVVSANADDKKAAKSSAKKAPAAPAYKIVTAADLKFTPAEGVTGVETAALWGDSKKGEYGSITKFAPGTAVNWHTHTSAVRLVMISGTLVLEAEGQAPKELTAGAYAYEPGKVKHKTSCKAGADCIFFVHQHAAFDVIPAEAKK